MTTETSVEQEPTVGTAGMVTDGQLVVALFATLRTRCSGEFEHRPNLSRIDVREFRHHPRPQRCRVGTAASARSYMTEGYTVTRGSARGSRHRKTFCVSMRDVGTSP
jgi:hypothetical protein